MERAHSCCQCWRDRFRNRYSSAWHRRLELPVKELRYRCQNIRSDYIALQQLRVQLNWPHLGAGAGEPLNGVASYQRIQVSSTKWKRSWVQELLPWLLLGFARLFAWFQTSDSRVIPGTMPWARTRNWRRHCAEELDTAEPQEVLPKDRVRLNGAASWRWRPARQHREAWL